MSAPEKPAEIESLRGDSKIVCPFADRGSFVGRGRIGEYAFRTGIAVGIIW